MLELFGVEKQEEVIEEQNEQSKITIFTYLQDIMIHKKGNVMVKDPTLSKFNTYQILRFLSYDEGYLPFINVLNEFQDNLTKEEAYKTLLITIPQSKRYLHYPKKTGKEFDEETVDVLANYFVCAKHEVEDFLQLDLIKPQVILKIKNMYGGKR